MFLTFIAKQITVIFHCEVESNIWDTSYKVNLYFGEGKLEF